MAQEDSKTQWYYPNDNEQDAETTIREECLDCRKKFPYDEERCSKCSLRRTATNDHSATRKMPYTTRVPKSDGELADFGREGWEGYVAAGSKQDVEHNIQVNKPKTPKMEHDSYGR